MNEWSDERTNHGASAAPLPLWGKLPTTGLATPISLEKKDIKDVAIIDGPSINELFCYTKKS